jgi:xanthine dehydrogenase/oxidase
MHFCQLAQACYMERVDLSAHGFYATPNIGFDWTIGKGTPFNYFTYGAAFAEVEIDTLTGDFYTRTADIVMDLGFSINPAIDIGQVCALRMKCFANLLQHEREVPSTYFL